jgi:hypothetical protein
LGQNIIIDKNIMSKYEEEYFVLYPKRRKFPKYFLNPIPISLNKFTSLVRMAQNDLKQKYKEFAIWLAKYYCIDNLQLNKAIITYSFYFNNKHKHDMDNYVLVQKFLGDGFVQANVFIDDNSDNLQLRFNPFLYDVNYPRIEILLEY